MKLATVRPSAVLLDGRAGWRIAGRDGVRVRPGAPLRLEPLSATGALLADPSGNFGGLTLPTGTAVDADGTPYELERTSLTVRRLDRCQGWLTLPCLGGQGSRPRHLRDPHGLAVSPRGDLLVADTGNRRVQVFTLKGLTLRGLWRAAGREMWAPWDVAVGVDCRAYVSDRAGGRVHVFGPGGRRIATLPAVDEPPLRRPTALALGADQRLYVVEEGVKHVTIIDLASGRRIGTATRADELTAPLAGSGAAVAASAPERFAASGSVVSEPLDSGIYRCAWHRVVLSATLARGTAVRVDTFTSEAPRTAAEIAALPEDRWSTGQVDTDTRAGDWDCLVTSAEGRYLWLRLTLVGDGLSSPQLERVEAHFPRESSLRRLPAVYRADPEGGDFLDRYLSIFDTLWRDLGRRIDTMAGLFDPLAAPAEFLPWLASWIGLAFDGKWPVERRRRLLAEGVRLYGMRGTLAGLKRHIELYTGVEPRIVEHFKLRRWLFLDGARLGSNSTLWGQEVVRRLQLDERSSLGEFPLTDSGDPLRDPWRVHAHRFTVFVPIVGPEDEARRRTIEQIVELAKPAHTEGRVCFGGPGAAVGTRCLVGVDTVLGRPPSCTVEGQARLGRDSVLGLDPDEAPTPTLRIGSRSRIGSTTRID